MSRPALDVEQGLPQIPLAVHPYYDHLGRLTLPLSIPIQNPECEEKENSENPIGSKGPFVLNLVLRILQIEAALGIIAIHIVQANNNADPDHPGTQYMNPKFLSAAAVATLAVLIAAISMVPRLMRSAKFVKWWQLFWDWFMFFAWSGLFGAFAVFFFGAQSDAQAEASGSSKMKIATWMQLASTGLWLLSALNTLYIFLKHRSSAEEAIAPVS